MAENQHRRDFFRPLPQNTDHSSLVVFLPKPPNRVYLQTTHTHKEGFSRHFGWLWYGFGFLGRFQQYSGAGRSFWSTLVSQKSAFCSAENSFRLFRFIFFRWVDLGLGHHLDGCTCAARPVPWLAGMGINQEISNSKMPK